MKKLKPGWYWINQPSKLQPYHKYSGYVGVYDGDDGFHILLPNGTTTLHMPPDKARLALSKYVPGQKTTCPEGLPLKLA